MKKRPTQEREVPSKVLLVCVYDTVVVEVSNEAVFARFSLFGPIVKILIFEKGEVTKFFLEFVQVEDAAKARAALDGSKLYESICKMNIYFSNFASVDLKHETTEGVSLEALAYSPAPPYFYYPQAAYYNYSCLYNMGHPDELACLAERFQGLAIEPQGQPLRFFYPLEQDALEGATAPEATQNLEETIESNIDWLLRSEQKKLEVKGEEKARQLKEKSCYLSFELAADLTNRNVYNLFSNFGNISYVKKTKKTVYIKFRSLEFAAMAKNYLQGHSLLENYLDLAYVTNPSDAEPREEEYSEITYYDTTFDRFTPQKSITINPPGSTLHVSSLRRESCRYQNLKYIFEEFGAVEGVEILGGSSDKNMALVKFRNIEDSFYAIAEMHNRSLLGRKVQLSFTKSKVY